MTPAFARALGVVIIGLGALAVTAGETGLADVPAIHSLFAHDDPGTLGDTDSGSPLETTCDDVTSYDDNWDNDMLCTRPDGTQFSTSYDGAKPFTR